MNPPVPTTAPSGYCSRPASSESAVASITMLQRDAVAGELRRVDLHVALLEPLAVDVDVGDARHAHAAAG